MKITLDNGEKLTIKVDYNSYIELLNKSGSAPRYIGDEKYLVDISHIVYIEKEEKNENTK